MYLDTGTLLILAALWAAWQTWMMRKVLASVESMMEKPQNPFGKMTFADLVDHEKQMASLPDNPPAVKPDAGTPWELMRRTHEQILRDRGLDSAPFPWTKEQCDAYWRSQEIVIARRHPDLAKDAYFNSLVNKEVVDNMIAKAPRQEEGVEGFPPCAICGDPGVMMTADAAYCGPHAHAWRHGASVPPPGEPDAPSVTMPVVTPASAQIPDGECGASDGTSYCDLPAGHGNLHSWAAPSGGDNHRDMGTDAFRDMLHARYDR